MDRQYEPGTGLGKLEDGILTPIELNSQDITFGLGFKLIQKDIKAMAKKRERRHAKATRQTFDASIKMPHFIVIFQVPLYVYQRNFLPDPSGIRVDTDEQESWAVVHMMPYQK